jgi:hypothetical protein
MTDFESFLRTDAADVGCDAAFEVLDRYAELVADGIDAEAEYPGVAVHLTACGPCGADFDGLLAAIRAEQAI